MSLERDILNKYVKLKMWRFTLALYYGFEVVILLLGLAVTWGSVRLEVLAASWSDSFGSTNLLNRSCRREKQATARDDR